MSTKIFIIGGSGFIGARLTQLAIASGHDVAYTYTRHPKPFDATEYQVDLTKGDDAALELCLFNERPQVVFHCAVPLPTQSDPQAHQQISVDSVARALATLSKVAPDALFVYLSTNAVFGGHDGPFREDDTPDPEGRTDAYRNYGLTKAAGEKIALEQWPNSLVVRTANVDGYTVDGVLSPRIANFVEKLQKGEPLPRFVDRYITPTLVDTLVAAMLEMAQPAFEHRGILHVAAPQAVTDHEQARLLATHLGFDESLVQRDSIANSPMMKKSLRNAALDVAFTQSLLETRLLTVEEQIERLQSGRVAR